MGRVRTKTIKKAARIIVEKYYPKLTLDFHVNKKVCGDVAIIPSKRLRNKIAGYVTHLMRRIQEGPVRGISLKLQEEERERRENYIPDHSIMEDMTASIEVDAETKNLLKAMGLGNLAGIEVAGEHPHHGQSRQRRERREPREPRQPKTETPAQ